ncbi:hypothetical protein EJ06DRAFT_529634 [Trichodelitschia bisporula]|uniref:Uncharacterized protein n=1 Tax=Trichodelitschia bisporula TaxID=703511 RepID=A0A6G1I0C9_9PEZI|nr:hypothetical protein EJ06DRAFT_529634 [Trichodelitschia bisporula]
MRCPMQTTKLPKLSGSLPIGVDTGKLPYTLPIPRPHCLFTALSSSEIPLCVNLTPNHFQSVFQRGHEVSIFDGHPEASIVTDANGGLWFEKRTGSLQRTNWLSLSIAKFMRSSTMHRGSGMRSVTCSRPGQVAPLCWFQPFCLRIAGGSGAFGCRELV